ncbi:hypothetical protein [Haloquadratum walsbyi]|jgi:hypothetical protein|uniref:Uncharacterized protein n=1 Tax=Haloquadratum walsbyi (strain DSM 16790 / HBSQ001) TaxID=362976 RepID=Q18JF6_HALWD|nr:hypothetical protein [Haloquadratum walsbyi]CAJ51851.1 uncharacterized protein HQ_1723A [Haloquadratum walsbyi DSM 16790]
MNDADDDSLTWTDVIDATIDEEVSRDEAIQLTAEDLAVDIPIHFDVDTDADVDADADMDADVMSEESPPDHDRARWRFDGTLNVTVEGVRGPLSEWLRLWTRE